MALCSQLKVGYVQVTCHVLHLLLSYLPILQRNCRFHGEWLTRRKEWDSFGSELYSSVFVPYIFVLITTPRKLNNC